MCIGLLHLLTMLTQSSDLKYSPSGSEIMSRRDLSKVDLLIIFSSYSKYTSSFLACLRVSVRINIFTLGRIFLSSLKRYIVLVIKTVFRKLFLSKLPEKITNARLYQLSENWCLCNSQKQKCKLSNLLKVWHANIQLEEELCFQLCFCCSWKLRAIVNSVML